MKRDKKDVIIVAISPDEIVSKEVLMGNLYAILKRQIEIFILGERDFRLNYFSLSISMILVFEVLMSKYNILIVEDELIPANYLKKILEQHGYRVVGMADSKKSALEYTYKNINIDLVLMDIQLKDKKDGIEIAKYLQSYLPVAILFITAYSDMEYLERAKDIDAIGYLVKPVQANTLLSTIEVGMSKFKTSLSNDTIPLCNDIIFDVRHQAIKANQKTIDLTFQECMIFKTLLQNKNNITTIEELENVFYQIGLLTEGALRTTIWRLRKKLPDDICIETIYKSGYKIKI